MAQIGPTAEAFMQIIRTKLQDKETVRQWAGEFGEPCIEAILARYQTSLSFLKGGFFLILLLLGFLIYLIYTRFPEPKG